MKQKITLNSSGNFYCQIPQSVRYREGGGLKRNPQALRALGLTFIGGFMSAAGKDAIAILEKHGIKPNKSQRAKVAVEERSAAIVKELNDKVKAKGPSRNDLMLQAKAKGIKNFRILNKADLYKVLDPATIQQEIDSIVTDAVVKWKQGWGSRTKVSNA